MTTAAVALTKEDARRVVISIGKLNEGRRNRQEIARILDVCSSNDAWSEFFALLPLDSSSFLIEFGVARDELIKSLGEWCIKFRRRPDLTADSGAVTFHGFACVLAMTLITMHEAMHDINGTVEQSTSKNANKRHDCDSLCREFVKDAAVMSAVQALYDPRGRLSRKRAPNTPAGKASATLTTWRSINFETAVFLEHGSTSFILRCTAVDSSNSRYAAALKCVLLPYAAITSIAAETLRYAEEYNADESEDGTNRIQHMVRVRASSRQWILMDYVPGRTLAQEIEHQAEEFEFLEIDTPFGKRARHLAGNVRLDIIHRLGLPLLAALDELLSRGRVHQDLSPSNIIVSESADSAGRKQFHFTFIDFGRNYLYARSVAGAEPFSGRYVAPEIKENRTLPDKDKWRSDLYSFGQILAVLGNVFTADPAIVPDRFYAQTPLLARLIEDLVDAVPENRLLVFEGIRESAQPYEALRRTLRQELDATQSAISSKGVAQENLVPYDRETYESLLGGLIPLSKEPKRRQRVYQARKRQRLTANPRRSFYARWLLGFSVVASICYYIAGMACVVWFWRDLGIGVLSPAQELAFRTLGLDQNWIPIIDNLRSPNYHLGDLTANLPARIIGISFALAALRYYQNILGSFTTRAASTHRLPGSFRRGLTEFFCRMMSVYGLPLILFCNLVNPASWPIASALGYTGVLLSNVSSATFSEQYLAKARSWDPTPLSTVPRDRRQVIGLDGFRRWGPTTFYYVLVVWALAIPIYYGIFKDVYVYALVVAVINIGLFYVIKTGFDSLDIRTGLTRAVLASERLRYIADRQVSDDSRLPPSNPTPVG